MTGVNYDAVVAVAAAVANESGDDDDDGEDIIEWGRTVCFIVLKHTTNIEIDLASGSCRPTIPPETFRPTSNIKTIGPGLQRDVWCLWLAKAFS